MFFQYIDQVLSPGVDLNLTISKTANGLTVLVMPRVNGLKDPAKNILPPMNLRGLPQELDANFFPAITSPLQRSSSILLDMGRYEAQQEEAEKASKAAKDLKEKEAKEKKEKKDKYDAAVKKAEELETAGKLREAVGQYEEAKKYAVDKAAEAVNEKIGAIKVKLSQGNLFDTAAVQAAPATGQHQSVQAVPVPAAQQDNAVRQQTAQPPQTNPDPFARLVIQQPAGVQSNERDSGLFGTPQQQMQQPQQPVTHPQETVMAAPNFTNFGGEQAHRDNEYEEYEDFPKDMPPLYRTKPVETGVQTI